MTESPLPGTKTLIIGGSGSGKTTAIKTLVEAGIHVRAIFTENSFDVLGDTDPEKISWVYVKPVKEDFKAFMDTIKKMGIMSFEQMTKMVDPTRSQDNRFYEMIAPLMSFTCARTGKNFGNISDWSTGTALVYDSLSGLSKAAMHLVAGNRPALNMSDYGMAQKALEGLINQITTDYRCHVACIAHAEQELDPINGGTKITASLVGKALAPIVPRYFTDVVYAKRNGTDFSWDTADPRADLKTRNLAISNKLPASFGPLIAAWKKRGGIIEEANPGLMLYTPEETKKLK